MSSPVLYALAALVAFVALLVAGLRALAAVGARMQRPATMDTSETSSTTAAIVPAGPGWLSDEQKAAEEWRAETTRRDLDRLNAICDRLVLHPLRVVCEDAIRELLRPDERGWVRVHSGEYELVGVA